MEAFRIIDGRQVRAVRAMLGLTQAELGTAVGLNRQSIFMTEKRRRLSPRSLVAERVGRYGAENGVVAEIVNGSPCVRISDGRTGGDRVDSARRSAS